MMPPAQCSSFDDIHSTDTMQHPGRHGIRGYCSEGLEFAFIFNQNSGQLSDILIPSDDRTTVCITYPCAGRPHFGRK